MLIKRTRMFDSIDTIHFVEYHFCGFIAHKKGFTNKLLSSFAPFSNNKAAWHILGFRFTKTYGFVSKTRQEINGWYTKDKNLVSKLRQL